MPSTLADLLDELRRRFAPSYEAGLTNHLPMACIALDPLRNRVDFKKLLESIDNAKTETVK